MTKEMPPTYATLSTTTLEEELNPFEESFETATTPLPSKNSLCIGHAFVSNDNNSSHHTLKKSKNTHGQDEEKRKDFLERNRIAALKCRKRKKQWVDNLQLKAEYLTSDNEQFKMKIHALNRELTELRAILMQHKHCPINEQALLTALK